jgi:pyruvate kinase
VVSGDRLLIDDGKVRLKVLQVQGRRIVAEVQVGGTISDNKGVNVPGVVVPIPALTDKDRSDLQFALEQNADWIALSFVQRPEDVAEARALIGEKAALMAKIEKPAAIDRLSDIIALSDGVMVARGDLGRRASAGGRPAAPEQDCRLRPSVRQAGRRRHPDARIDD